MITESALLKNRYYDSVFLMRVSKRLGEQEGIAQAALVMGTPRNIQILAEAGYGGVEALGASSNDLIVSLKAESVEAARLLLDSLDQWVIRDSSRPMVQTVRSTEQALALQPGTNVAVISVPGEYATGQARRALMSGLNVFLFSDHVPIEDELSLKRLAMEKGLLLMGPDCGTSIVGGVGLGFANRVRRGQIGIIGASGTGIQEVSSLIHRWGSGISHAIGVGGRDLSDDIGGISTVQTMGALERDPNTSVILLVSKPPGAATINHLNRHIAECSKPVVTCYIGGQEGLSPDLKNTTVTDNLDDAAAAAIRLSGGIWVDPNDQISPELVQGERAKQRASQKFVRGVFSGGTLCYQAQQVFRSASRSVHSNEPLERGMVLPGSAPGLEHTLMDMGADEFTEGKPHPMVDSTQRIQRILSEAADPQVAVILLDCILGYVAADNPGGDIAPAIREAKSAAERRGDHLSVVVSVCGTELDSQGLDHQINLLQEAGAIVFTSGLQAARFAVQLISGRD